MPKMSVTPWETIVSTSASEGVIFTLPETTLRSPRAMSFMGSTSRKTNGKNSDFGTVYANGRRQKGADPPRPERRVFRPLEGVRHRRQGGRAALPRLLDPRPGGELDLRGSVL